MNKAEFLTAFILARASTYRQSENIRIDLVLDEAYVAWRAIEQAALEKCP